jgi:SAM-dependent methyltransferase
VSVGEALARWYDLDLGDDTDDLDLYRALAGRTRGPVLELAAGSGRIAVPLAADGLEVVAVDNDPAMLARARARWAAARRARHVRQGGSLELIEADLFDLAIEPRFGLAVLALNSCFLLGDVGRQQAAISVMARHLRRGGLAVIDAWLPSAEDLAIYDGRLVLEWVRDDPESGLRVAKMASAAYDAPTRRLELTSIFDSSAPEGGPVTRHLRRDVLHLSSAQELIRAATDAGLAIDQLGGDHELAPFGAGSPRVVVVAGLV